MTRDGVAVVSELSVSKVNLRHLLFAPNRLPERLLLKLQELTGLEMVSKQQIENKQAGSPMCIDGCFLTAVYIVICNI